MSQPSYELINIHLRKKAGESLGIAFDRKSAQVGRVAGVVEGSSLHRTNQIEPGDIVVKLNDINVQEESADRLLELLQEAKEDEQTTLTLQRNTEVEVEGPPVQDKVSTPTIVENLVNSSPPLPQPAAKQRAGRTRKMPAIGRPNTFQHAKSFADSGPDSHEDDSNKPIHLKPIDGPTKKLSLTPENKQHKKAVLALQPSKSLDLGALPQWRSRTFVSLHNYTNGEQTTDRLHVNKDLQTKITGCHATHCVGSQIWPREMPHRRPYGPPRPKEEMKTRAESYLRQYYETKKSALGPRHEQQLQARLSQVKHEIEEKGHYDLTYEELAYGARLAWRNAPRCVNRIQWRQLELLDARDANTPKEMFEAIKHHLRYATNGGNLRSTITIFRHRVKEQSDFRVWNYQVIRYAGYKMSDGSIVGDPDSVEFTEVCMRLGWNPPIPRGRFDILPLVLQANGGDPELFEIPPELCMEVPICHPQYSWFADLNLRWYAVPAVSCLMLDIGGLEFTAAPFNGWYMSSEIGARNFGDEYRYNLLKPVAQRMGLDLQTNKMWKDRALVELNVAVLHSYQKAGVSIVDHHAATSSFMTFFKSEMTERGGCPSDWVWLVPPISGSATPVFHQEMLLYYLDPSYEYQDQPWKHYQLPGEVPRYKPKFRAVAEMVRDAGRMMRKVLSRRVKATILYATETGCSKSYATMVKDLFDRAFACTIHCMEDYNKANLEQEQLMLIVTSTFGSGDPPSNGETFGRYLVDLRNGKVMPGAQPTRRSQRYSCVTAPNLDMINKANQDGAFSLSQVRYAVFGLGSRAYPNFCSFAHTVDNLMLALGADQIYTCGEGDELCGQEESFQLWLKECYLKACEIYKVDHRLEENEMNVAKEEITGESYRIVPYTGQLPNKDLPKKLSQLHGKQVGAAKLKARKKLQAAHSDRTTILVKLESVGQMFYQPGDHLAIYPQNNTALVKELLQRIPLPCDPDEPITIQSRIVTASDEVKWKDEKRLPSPVTIREALTNYLDIANPPFPHFLRIMAKLATRKMERDELEELGKGAGKYEEWKYGRQPNLLDMINEFHSIKLSIPILLQHLPLLQCRYYSISSSPRMFPGEIHCTVAVVLFRKRNGMGPKHHGVCSTWLNKMEIGTALPCLVRKAHAFHLPEDTRVPVVMVGPGTGIAPFRAFWQERMYQRNEALKQQLLTSSAFTRQPKKVDSSDARSQIPDIPANKLSITGRSRHTSTVTPPVLSLLNVEKERRKVQLPLVFNEEDEDEDEDDIDGDKPKHSKTPSEKRVMHSRNLIRRSASDESQNQDLSKLIASREQMWGKMVLYFGCRHNDDYIYKDEITKAHITGALTEANVGFSRVPGQSKTYVQHLLKQNADDVVSQLIQERGHFYVCGDISMAAAVGRTLQNVFEENAAMSTNEAQQYIQSMKENGFYHEDIFGVTLKTAEVTQRVRTAAKTWRVLVTAAGGENSPVTPMSSRPPASPLYPTPETPDAGRLFQHAFRTNTHKRPTITVLGQVEPSSPGRMSVPSVGAITQQRGKRSAPAPCFPSSRKHYQTSGTLEEVEEEQSGRLQLFEMTDSPTILEIESPAITTEAKPIPQPDNKRFSDYGGRGAGRSRGHERLRGIKSHSSIQTSL